MSRKQVSTRLTIRSKASKKQDFPIKDVEIKTFYWDKVEGKYKMIPENELSGYNNPSVQEGITQAKDGILV